jgi:hypothetical protein
MPAALKEATGAFPSSLTDGAMEGEQTEKRVGVYEPHFDKITFTSVS